MSGLSDPQHHSYPPHVSNPMHASYPMPVNRDDQTRARAEARRWVRRKQIFATIVTIYSSLSLMWFAIDMLDDSTGFWFYWPMLGTGLGVALTGIGLFGLGGLLGADWERREINKYLQRHSDRTGGPGAGF
jgi:hypothetical protein